MTVDNLALDTIFRNAKTYGKWLDEPVDDEVISALYGLIKMAPTSANCCPMRLVFIRSKEGKEKLLTTLSPGNVEKTRAAPLTVICAWDEEFYEQLPILFPHADFRSGYAKNRKRAEQAGTFNASLQAGYFILAARSVGLDCGPMAGFSKEKVNELFLADTKWKSLMLCNIGYGDESEQRRRDPRLTMEQACRFA